MYYEKILSRLNYFSDKPKDAVMDFLTNCVNRRHIIEYVKYLIDNNRKFTLLFLDIDNFKMVNDIYGHQVGDRVLGYISDEILRAVGESGVVGRYGGDEFLAVIYDIEEYGEVWKYVKELQNHIFRKRLTDDVLSEFYLTGTIGVVSYPNDGETYDKLIIKADKALYRGKQKGRNCFIIYNDEMHADIDVSVPRGFDACANLMTKSKMIMSEDMKFEERLKKVFTEVCKYCTITGIEFVSRTYTIGNNEKNHFPFEFSKTLCDDANELNYVANNNYSELKGKYPTIHVYCWDKQIKSFMIFPIYYKNNFYGYLNFMDSNRKRIWQAEDRVIYSYIASLLSLYLALEEK